MHLSVFHVKQLFLFDGMEGLQQVVEIVHAVILQFDAALFPPGDDPTAASQGISQIAGGLLSIVYGDAGGGEGFSLFSAVSFFTSSSVWRTDRSFFRMEAAAVSCRAGDRGNSARA